MSKTRHPHSKLITDIGADALKAQFGLSAQRLHGWRVRGIPHTHRPAIAQLAMLKGMAVPSDFLAPPESTASLTGDEIDVLERVDPWKSATPTETPEKARAA